MTPAAERVPPPTRLPGWVTAPLARLYDAEVARRNRRFDRGIGVTRLDRPVISVGNLSAGGTGKTPMVRWVVRELQRLGRRPVIAMRGYKPGPDGVSDEAAEHAATLPGVPVVAQPDRLAGLRSLFRSPEGQRLDCVVLDDGFQHRRLARDLDIVLVDATRPFYRDALLPAGFLREPPSSLRRADAVVITRAEQVDETELRSVHTRIQEAIGNDSVPVLAASMEWGSVRQFGSKAAEYDVSALHARRLVLACAIGNPRAFERAATEAGVAVVDRLVLPDHARYTSGVMQDLSRMVARTGADGALTTMKDWVKMERVFVPAEFGVWVPQLDVRLSGHELGEALRSVL